MQKSKTKALSLLFMLFCLFLGQSVYAQVKEISGTVSDVEKEPLIGVFITVKEVPTVGTATDLDGKYKLALPAGAKTLVFSYLGMQSQEFPIKGAVLDVVMKDNVSELEEVVVIGYGSVKRKDLTGPVASVQGDALRAIPVANVAEAITGKLAGVQVTATEGSPDAEMKIRVRGGGSISQDNTPLFIVDGFPMDNISNIASTDIESMDVLKDASSTAIYGSRGANGVIIITTRSAKEGKLTVNYNAYVGFKKMAKKLDVLGVSDYLDWQYELALLRNGKGDATKYEKYFGPFQDMDLYDGVKGNNWQDQIYGRTGTVFNHNLSLSGGSETIKFVFNYAYVDDKAIMYGSNYNRNNLSLKLNHKPMKTLSFDYSVRYSSTKIAGGGLNDQQEKSSSDARMRHSMIYRPLPFAIQGGDENAGDQADDEETSSDMVNPFRAIADTERRQDRRALNMAGAVTWEIVSNLKLKVDVGYNYNRSEDDRFYGLSTYYVKNMGLTEVNPAVVFVDNTKTSFRNANTLNYDFKKLIKSKNHSLAGMLGSEIIETRQKINTNEAAGLPNDFKAKQAFTLSSLADVPRKVDDFYSPDDKMVSFFARGNYSYMSKYILTATFRADGTNRFLDSDNKWGYFPSAAAAWRMSSEKFMESTKTWLDDMKLRFSYGAAGNNNIPLGILKTEFEGKTTDWLYGTSNVLTPSKIMPNPALKWETTYTKNVGLDFTVLGGRLNASVDLYLNNTKDLLILFPIPGSGYDGQYRNMGETENKGLEIQLNYVALDKKDYGLSFNFNVGFNKNKVKSLGGMNDFYYQSGWNSEIGDDYSVAVGQAVGMMYGYESDGRYELSDFKEYDGSKWVLNPGVYDSSPLIGDKELRPGAMKLKSGEKKIIGNANPKNTGGFTINGRAYGFDLSAAFNWSIGNDIYNANKIEYTSSSKYDYRNMISTMESGKRWTNLTADGQITNDMDELATLNANTTMWSPFMKQFLFTDWAVEDGSFLRLNTLTLGYTLPARTLSKTGIKSLRFYASAYNVFCITSYSGFDPEVSTRRKTNLTPGVDYSAYPKSRQFLFGMNISF